LHEREGRNDTNEGWQQPPSPSSLLPFFPSFLSSDNKECKEVSETCPILNSPSNMARYKLIIEYDGTHYGGWQMQQNARSIQGLLIHTGEEFFKERVEIQGAGRTDAGVHALAQVAHLEVDAERPAHLIQWEFNERLPSDIHILSVERMPPRFHARHDALGRSYLYQISRRRTAFAKRYVWWVKDKFNVYPMKGAAQMLVGMHDFANFADKRIDETQTKVLVESAEVGEAGDLILFRIRASHFVWKMVRRLVGALVEIGRGALKPSDLQTLLETPSGAPAQWTAPPSGLFLEQVIYPGESWHKALVPAIPLTNVKRDT
jgi:tRNA pseudouridine38-40 synthase